jgi:pimeloyl-ACP methyl ester carboxylesterase
MPEIEITGARLYYEVSGTGEPILLIPGLGMDHTYYRLGVPLLARSLQVFAVDPRGIGQSTKSPPPYTVEAWADDFAAMIDKLGFGPIHVLGSSLGGAMALALAQRHSDKLKSLMVVGGFSEIDRATELNFRLRLRLIQKLGMSDEVAD